MRALIDSNIMLDILLKRDFDQDALEQLRIMKSFGDVDLWASAKSYADCFYFLSKYLGSEAAYRSLEGTLDWLGICSVDKTDIESALAQHWKDFEDCLINESAKKIKADYLITRDQTGFEQSSIPHGDAADFMAYVAETLHLEYALEDA